MDLLQKKYIEEICKEYEEGITLSQIAKKRQKSVSFIKVEILELGGEKGKQILLEELEKRTGLSVNEVIQEYKKYMSINKVIEVFGVPRTRIEHVIGQYEIITGEKIVRQHFIEESDIDQIIEKYKKGKTETKIESETGIALSIVRSVIKKYADKEGCEIYYKHYEEREKNKNSKKNKKYHEDNNEKERIEELKKCNKYIMVKAIEILEEENQEQEKGKEGEELEW